MHFICRKLLAIFSKFDGNSAKIVKKKLACATAEFPHPSIVLAKMCEKWVQQYLVHRAGHINMPKSIYTAKKYIKS